MKKKTCLILAAIICFLILGFAVLFYLLISCSLTDLWGTPPWCGEDAGKFSVPITIEFNPDHNKKTTVEATLDLQQTVTATKDEKTISTPSPTTEEPYLPPVFSVDLSQHRHEEVWTFIQFPSNQFQPMRLLLHPLNEHILYVINHAGPDAEKMSLLISRNGGQDWELALEDHIIRDIAVHPLEPDTIFVNADDELWVSRDTGKNWELLQAFENKTICVIFVSPVNGDIFVVPGWQEVSETGVYRSIDNGLSWEFIALGITDRVALFWDMAQEPTSGALILTAEISDHPQPYHPPFFISYDGGDSWEERFDLPWHALKVEIDPLSGDIYILTEGRGLYRSMDTGKTFQRLSNQFWSTLKVDPNTPTVIYGGNHTYHDSGGGIYRSTDGGKNFLKIALDEKIVSSIQLNTSSSKIFVVCYPEGIFIADVDDI